MSMLHAHKKKFWKKVDIAPSPDGYLIQLDGRTPKTPLLKLLCAPTKPLALAIANEWHMQREYMDVHTMPLTQICNTTIDNPTGISKLELVNEILEFFHTDTICCLSEEPERLAEYQAAQWTPIRDWFAKRYNIGVSASENLFTTNQSDATIDVMRKELMACNKWQLNAIQTAVDGTKSFILPMAVIGERLSVEEAVYLSRLETEYQIELWGNFDAVHEMDRFNHETALSAGALFYHLSPLSSHDADTCETRDTT